jgi:hypothetical protein
LRLDDLREPALVGPWLRAITFSKCQRVLRRANHNEAASASVTDAEHARAPEEALQLRSDLLRAIATLPETGWAKEYDRPDMAALLENASSVAE